MPIDLKEARRRLQWQRDRGVPVRELARRMGAEKKHRQLNNFLGSGVTPRVMAEAVLTYAEGLPAPPEDEASQSVATVDTRERGSDGAGARVAISRDDAFYYRGVLDAELRTLGNATQQLGALGETLHAVRGLLDGAIGGVRTVAASGLLPVPNAAAESEAARRIAELEADVARLRKAAEEARRDQPAGEGRA